MTCYLDQEHLTNQRRGKRVYVPVKHGFRGTPGYQADTNFAVKQGAPVPWVRHCGQRAVRSVVTGLIQGTQTREAAADELGTTVDILDGRASTARCYPGGIVAYYLAVLQDQASRPPWEKEEATHRLKDLFQHLESKLIKSNRPTPQLRRDYALVLAARARMEPDSLVALDLLKNAANIASKVDHVLWYFLLLLLARLIYERDPAIAEAIRQFLDRPRKIPAGRDAFLLSRKLWGL